MAGKKHDDRVTEIAGGQNADEAPQVFKVGQMGSGRREFLKNALAGAAAGVSATTIGGCNDNPHASQCKATFLASHNSWVNSVAISPDGRLLASGSGDKTIKLWSLPDGALLKTLDGIPRLRSQSAPRERSWPREARVPFSFGASRMAYS